MLTLGAEILPYHAFGLEESLREIASLGFKEVNLWSARSPLPHHVSPESDPEEVRALLGRYGLRASALSVYGMTAAEVGERIELAGRLGIDTLVFDCEANYPDFVSEILPPLLETAVRNGVRIAVENHLTVPFTEDFESGGHEGDRWDEGVDSLAQIKRLVTELDHPNLGVCLAPPHLWVMGETIGEAIQFLMERKKLFFYYVWDISRGYRRGEDGLNFGPGDEQLPRPDGVLDHAVLFRTLRGCGYDGVASMCFHGTAGWSIERVTAELGKSTDYVRRCLGSTDAALAAR
jgi:sugar phosphate isomerase/epimerase